MTVICKALACYKQLILSHLLTGINKKKNTGLLGCDSYTVAVNKSEKCINE